MTLKEKIAIAAIVGIPMIVICCLMFWGYDALLGVLPKTVARPLAGIVFVVWLHWFLKDIIKDAIKEANDENGRHVVEAIESAGRDVVDAIEAMTPPSLRRGA
jgi:hypothetical protein